MPKTKESAIVMTIMKHLRALPRSWWVKYHGDNFGRAGVPDILGCLDGRFIALEVKRPGGKPTRIQCHEMEMLRGAGSAVAVVTCWKDVERVLQAMP